MPTTVLAFLRNYGNENDNISLLENKDKIISIHRLDRRKC